MARFNKFGNYLARFSRTAAQNKLLSIPIITATKPIIATTITIATTLITITIIIITITPNRFLQMVKDLEIDDGKIVDDGPHLL